MIVLEQMSLEVLEHKTLFYLPIAENNAIYELNKFRDIVNEIVGGSSLYKTIEGSWVNGKKITFIEEVEILEVYSDLNLLEQYKIIEAFKDFGINTKQEKLSVVYNDKMYYILIN